MDVSYKETVNAQINANALMDYDYKKDLLEIINKFSEEQLKKMSKSDSSRFFYKRETTEIDKTIKENLTDNEKKI